MTAAAALVLRPEPGNTATCARLAEAGIVPVPLPLFEACARPWVPPDPGNFDAVLLTSANAARLGGAGLAALAHLPALAVGSATARAARAAGFTVALTGNRDAAALLAAAEAAGYRRPLHLAGRDHRPAGAETRIVYATDSLPLPPGTLAAAAVRSGIALVHSPRAARRFAALVDAEPLDRARIGVAAISAAALAAAGTGWQWIGHPAAPRDAALVALARDRLTVPGAARISGA